MPAMFELSSSRCSCSRRALDMGANDDQSSGWSGRVFAQQLTSPQKRSRTDARSRPYERGAGAIEEPLPLRFGPQETEHDGPQILIVQSINHNWLATSYVTQPLGDPRRSSTTDFCQCQRSHLSRPDPAVRLLLDPARQRVGAVAERRVARELGLRRRDESIPVTHEMDVAGRDPAALDERRADEHAVDSAKRCRQRVRFCREVTAQG